MVVLNRPYLSMCVAVTMSLVYFFGFSFLETRAETWCNLPVIYGIYLVVKMIEADRQKRHLSATESIMLGVAFMSCLLIKWSIAAMMLSLCFALVILCSYNFGYLIRSILWFIGGAILLAMPFLIYLATQSAFVAFVEEYFLATATTSGVGETGSLIPFYINEARRIYHSPMSMAALFLACPGSLLLFRRKGWIKWLLPFCWLCFFVIGSYRNHWLYYLQSSLSFSLLGLIWIACSSWRIRYRGGVKATIAFLCATMVMTVYLNRVTAVNMFEKYHDVISIDSAIETMLGKGYKPKVLCYRAMDVGVGMDLKSIPATKYWTFQTGATHEMIENQDNAVRQRGADVIYTLSYNHHMFLRANGYRHIYEAKDSLANGRVRIYVKE